MTAFGPAGPNEGPWTIVQLTPMPSPTSDSSDSLTASNLPFSVEDITLETTSLPVPRTTAMPTRTTTAVEVVPTLPVSLTPFFAASSASTTIAIEATPTQGANYNAADVPASRADNTNIRTPLIAAGAAALIIAVLTLALLIVRSRRRRRPSRDEEKDAIPAVASPVNSRPSIALTDVHTNQPKNPRPPMPALASRQRTLTHCVPTTTPPAHSTTPMRLTLNLDFLHKDPFECAALPVGPADDSDARLSAAPLMQRASTMPSRPQPHQQPSRRSMEGLYDPFELSAGRALSLGRPEQPRSPPTPAPPPRVDSVHERLNGWGRGPAAVTEVQREQVNDDEDDWRARDYSCSSLYSDHGDDYVVGGGHRRAASRPMRPAE
ncbi:hypothetical protein HK101_000862, partial [Irineochytrium annulatum]